MIVSEYIDWLKTQDQEATVLCLVHYKDNQAYSEAQGGWCSREEFSPEEYSESSDFGKKFLLIGMDNYEHSDIVETRGKAKKSSWIYRIAKDEKPTN